MFQAGDPIGERYVVESLLGEGGLARVYRVRHTQLGTQHALKHLFLSRPGLQERLLREGRIQARLQHPHVVRVQDVLDVDGQPGLLMEFVEGSSLHELLAAGGALSLEESLPLFAQVLSGVAAAHRQGVLHRDLKPANILLARAGQGWLAKVADFGLAKVTDDTESRGRTKAGVTMGTPGYMAPEQVVSATDVDRRADVFALGVVLYEMLVGKSPFGRGDEFTTLSETVRGSYAPLGERVEGCPEEVQEAVAKALKPEAADRFDSCEDFARTLFATRPELLASVLADEDTGPGLAPVSVIRPAAPATYTDPEDLEPGGVGATLAPALGAETRAPAGQTLAPPELAPTSGHTLAPTASQLAEVSAASSEEDRESARKGLLWLLVLGMAAVAAVLLGVGVLGTGVLGGGAALFVGGGTEAEPEAIATARSPADAVGPALPADVAAVPAPDPSATEEEVGVAGAQGPAEPAEPAEVAAARQPASDADPSAPAAASGAAAEPSGEPAAAEAALEPAAEEAPPSAPVEGDGDSEPGALAAADGSDPRAEAEAASEPEAAPAAAAPALLGSWRGEANGRPLTLRITSQEGEVLRGEVSFLFGTTERVVPLSGRVDAASGRLSLREDGGSELVFNGTASSRSIRGDYMRRGQKKALDWNVEKQ